MDRPMQHEPPTVTRRTYLQTSPELFRRPHAELVEGIFEHLVPPQLQVHRPPPVGPVAIGAHFFQLGEEVLSLGVEAEVRAELRDPHQGGQGAFQ